MTNGDKRPKEDMGKTNGDERSKEIRVRRGEKMAKDRKRSDVFKSQDREKG